MPLSRFLKFFRQEAAQQCDQSHLEAVGLVVGVGKTHTYTGLSECEVEGCTGTARVPGSRPKVCEHHAKAERIEQEGQAPTRYCSGCCRQHPLSDFDGNKRTCRRERERYREGQGVGRRIRRPAAEEGTRAVEAPHD